MRSARFACPSPEKMTVLTVINRTANFLHNQRISSPFSAAARNKALTKTRTEASNAASLLLFRVPPPIASRVFLASRKVADKALLLGQKENGCNKQVCCFRCKKFSRIHLLLLLSGIRSIHRSIHVIHFVQESHYIIF